MNYVSDFSNANQDYEPRESQAEREIIKVWLMSSIYYYLYI